MPQNGQIDNRYFCLSPLYLPADWLIPGWFARVRNGPPLGPCSTLERIAEQTRRYVATHAATEKRVGNGLGRDFVGPVRTERRRMSGY